MPPGACYCGRMRRKAKICLILLPALVVSGCAASDNRYPSLEIREAERSGGTMQTPAQVIEPAPLNEAATADISQIRTRATSAHEAFMAAVPAARRTALRGANAAVATKAWGDAQVALADLESLRSTTAIALDDLDLIFVNEKTGFEQLQDVENAQQAVLPMVAEEDRILNELRRQLGR